MTDIVKLLTDGGVTLVIIAFFMYRDIKFMNTLQQTLTSLVDAINELRLDRRKENEDEAR